MVSDKLVWEKRTFTFNAKGGTVPRLMAIANEVERTKYGKSVLDLGCGLAILREILGEGFEYFGCDLSYSVVNLHKNVRIIQKDLDLEPLPFQDKRFNYIVCSGIIEYIEDLEKFLGNLHKSYGHERCLFLITIANAADVSYRLGTLMGFIPKYDLKWSNLYSLRGFRNLLNINGFNVLRYYPIYYSNRIPRPISRIIGRTFPSLLAGQFLFVCSTHSNKTVNMQTFVDKYNP